MPYRILAIAGYCKSTNNMRHISCGNFEAVKVSMFLIQHIKPRLLCVSDNASQSLWRLVGDVRRLQWGFILNKEVRYADRLINT